MSGPEGAPERPQAWERGDIARDNVAKRVGRVMGHVGPYYQLRPLNGGKEWEADPSALEPATLSDALLTSVAEFNRDSAAHRAR